MYRDIYEGVTDVQFLRHKRLTTFVLSLTVLFYAIPRLPVEWEASVSSLFGFSWLGFALLVVAANWRSTLGVDREETEQMKRIKHLKAWQREEWMRGGKDRYPRAHKQKVYHRDVDM